MLVKGCVHEVTIAGVSEVIAWHPRTYGRGSVVYNALHCLVLFEQKTGALEQTEPLAGWFLPQCFVTLRCLLEARLKYGGREDVRVLRSLETFSMKGLNASRG